MLSWIIGNTLVAACAAVGVAIIARLNPSRPAVNHTLWLACFALLVMPPLPMAGQLGAGLRSLTQPSAEPVATKIVTPVWGDGSYSDQVSESDTWVLASSKGSLVTTGAAAASTELTPLELELYLADLADVEQAAAQTTLLGRLRALLPDWTWATWLLAAWGLGSLACFAWAQSRVHGFHRMVKRSPAGPMELDVAVADVAGRLDVRAPRTRVLTGVGSPAVWCLGRPQLLWPATQVGSVATDLGTRSLIAHELAHIARRDHWVARFDVLAVAALWWNPLFWLIRRELHAQAEMACDALALSTYPGDRRRFAEALIEAHGRTTSAPLAMQGLCATTPDSKDFERRLTMIMKNKVSPGVSKGVAALALAGSVLLAPGIGSPTDEVVPGYLNLTATSADDDDLKAFVVELHDEAEQLFQMGEYPSSIAVFEELAEVAPDHGMAQARLGYMKIGLGMHAEAKRHFERELELGHGVATATYNLACCDALMGDVKGGLGHLARSMRMGFDQVEMLATDSDLDNLRGTRGFDAIVKLTESATELRQRIASGGDSNELRLAYATLARIASEDGAVIREYAMLVHNTGDYAASEKLFRRQAELGESPEVAHYNIGCAQARQGQSDEAFDSLFTSAKKGFRYPAVVDDEDLAELRSDKRFKKLVHALSRESDAKVSSSQALVDELRLPRDVRLTDVTDLAGLAELTDVTEYLDLTEVTGLEDVTQLKAQLEAYDADLVTLKAHLATVREDEERAQVIEQLRSQLAAKDGVVHELEVVIEQLRQDDRLQRAEGGAEAEARVRYERALSSGDLHETADQDGPAQWLVIQGGEVLENGQLQFPARAGKGTEQITLDLSGAAFNAESKAKLQALFEHADGDVEYELRRTLEVHELEEPCCDEIDVAEQLTLEALGYLGEAHEAEVLRVLTERIGTDGQEVRIRILTESGEPVEVGAEAGREASITLFSSAEERAAVVKAFQAKLDRGEAVDPEDFPFDNIFGGADERAVRHAAEQARQQAAEARETVRVRLLDAEGERAAGIEARRAAERARRDADSAREQADRARLEIDRARLESSEMEEAVRAAEAQVKELQRQVEIEALKREIERLERELDKAKGKSKGKLGSLISDFETSRAAAPVTTFTEAKLQLF